MNLHIKPDTNPIIRRHEKEKVVNVLITKKNETLNINGKWGSGKTFIAKLVQNELNQVNQNIIALRVNISDFSYVNDPFVIFLITILDYINDTSNQIDAEARSELLKSIYNVVSIISWASLLLDQSGTLKILIDKARDLAASKKRKESLPINQLELGLANIKSYQNAIKELCESIELICEKLNKDKIVIFVDDFDRVNPEFAFKVLNIIQQLKERIGRLQVCTIMNRKQFENQLCHLYGQNDNDEHYLTKYIDLEITVNNPIFNNPQAFYKDFSFDSKVANFEFISGWVSFLSVREVQIFSVLYQKKLANIFENLFACSGALPTDSDVAHHIILMYIILVKFNLDFNSYNSNLLNVQDVNGLAERLKAFYLKALEVKNYESQSVNVNHQRLGHITDMAFSFLLNKIGRGYSRSLDGGFMQKYEEIKSILDDAYNKYFRIDRS